MYLRPIFFLMLVPLFACTSSPVREPALASPAGQAMRREAMTLDLQVDDFVFGKQQALASIDLVPGQGYPFRNKQNAFLDNVKNQWEKRFSVSASRAVPAVDSSPRRRVSNSRALIERNEKRFRIPNRAFYSVAISEREAKAQLKIDKLAKKAAKVIPGADDLYEKNDIRENAFDLRRAENQWLHYLLGEGSLRNSDWYQIRISPYYKELVLDLRFQHYYGDLSLKLYSSEGELIAISDASSDDEFLRLVLQKAGDYFVEVSGESTGNSYDFKWETFWTGGQDDSYEENDSPQRATSLARWEGQWLSDLSGEGVAGDDDFYSIRVNGRRRLVVDLRFEHRLGDLDLKIYDSHSKQIASSTRLQNDERIDIELPSAGIYFIRVYPFEKKATSNLYDLKWSSYMRSHPEVEDGFEPNDLPQDSVARIEFGKSIEGRQFDVDWYRLAAIEANELIEIQFENKGAGDDLFFLIYDQELRVIAGQKVLGGTQQKLDLNLVGGGYFVKVIGQNLGAAYQINASTRRASR